MGAKFYLARSDFFIISESSLEFGVNSWENHFGLSVFFVVHKRALVGVSIFIVISATNSTFFASFDHSFVPVSIAVLKNSIGAAHVVVYKSALIN